VLVGRRRFFINASQTGLRWKTEAAAFCVRGAGDMRKWRQSGKRGMNVCDHLGPNMKICASGTRKTPQGLLESVGLGAIYMRKKTKRCLTRLVEVDLKRICLQGAGDLSENFWTTSSALFIMGVSEPVVVQKGRSRATWHTNGNIMQVVTREEQEESKSQRERGRDC
jgi:hypothetical protein